MPVIWSGPGGWVPGGAPPETEQIWAGTSVGRNPTVRRPKCVLGLVYMGGGVDGIINKGLQEGGNESHQTLDTLCTLPCAGYDHDSVGKEPPPTPLL